MTNSLIETVFRTGIVIGSVIGSVILLAANSSDAGVYPSPDVPTSLIMEGNYILTGISNNGTLGVGNNKSPGFIFDSSGTGDFAGKPDYLTPGVPAEGFSMTYAGSGPVPLVNNNSGGVCDIGSVSMPLDVSATSSYDNAVEWTGTISGVLTVRQVYGYDNDDKSVQITATVTALTDVNDLTFARWIDPDCGGYNSINNRGNDVTGLAPENWVNSVSVTNNATLGLYSVSPTNHNTGFTSPWEVDPSYYIAGGLNGDGTTREHIGDDMIGIGFNIGHLGNGESVVLNYEYVVAADPDDPDIGTGAWIGGVDTAWDDNANWDPQKAPTDGANVRIRSSANPTVNHNVTGNTYANWTFETSSAKVTIEGNDVTIADGKTIKNDSSYLQTFAVNTIVAGNMTIEGGTHGLSFQGVQIADNSALTFNTGSSDNSINGAISGVGSLLTVEGTGTLALSGANTYSGGTNVTAGTLVGNTTSLQGDIINNNVVEFNQSGSGTYAGKMSGSGSLTKAGAGTLALSGANTYSGGTNVNGGAIAVGADNHLGDASGELRFNDGTLIYSSGFTSARSVTLNAGGGTFDTNGNNAELSGIIAGAGSLTKTGTGTLTLSGNSIYTGGARIIGGCLILNGISMSDYSVSSGCRFRGNGTVANLNNNGTVAPGNSIGTITVLGNYAHSAAAIYEVEINTSGQSDLIDVTGSATINGGTLDVQPEAGIYTVGTSYTILEADGGVSGTFDSLVGGVPGMRLQLLYNLDSIVLYLTSSNYADYARTPNQHAVANVLDQIAPGTGDMATVLQQLDTVITNPGGEVYFDQLAGEVFGTAASVSIENANLFLDTISRRLRVMDAYESVGGSSPCSGYATNSCDPRGGCQSVLKDTSCWRPWVAGYGVSANALSDGNASGFGYGIGGSTIAIDRLLDDNTRVGLVGGYGRSHIRTHGPAQQAFVNSGRFALYLHRYCQCQYLTAIAAYGHNNYDASRQLMFGSIARTASSDYHGSEFSCRIEGGRMFRWRSVQFQPYAALQYIGLHHSDFTETGSASANLAVNGGQFDSFRGILGSRFVWYDRSVAGRVIAPELHASWRHEFLNEQPLVCASFAGAPDNSFVIAGANLGRDAAILGGGLNVYFGDRFSLFAYYDIQANNVGVAHVGSGGLQFLW